MADGQVEEAADSLHIQPISVPKPLERLIDDWVLAYGQKVAVRDDLRSLTYDDLGKAADSFALMLTNRGIGHGDRVLVQLPNSGEFLVAFLGCQRAGAVPVLALMTHRSRELVQIARLANPSAIVTIGAYRSHNHGLDAERISERFLDNCPVIIADCEVDERRIAFRVINSFRSPGMHRMSLPKKHAQQTADDDVVILLSGGTTGIPKLVPHTHRDYIHAFTCCADASGINASTVFFAGLPAAHNFTLASPGILGVLNAGGTVVFGQTPNPERALCAIDEHSVNVAAIVPAVAYRWLRYIQSCDVNTVPSPKTLNVLLIGGAVTPAPLARELARVLDVTVQQVYGMSEGLVCMTRLDDPPEIVEGTQGIPVSTADKIRIVDTQGLEVPHGSIGELITRGPSTVRGYIAEGDALDRSAFDADGWYRTGDLVRKRADGRIEVVGRIKELINRGGEKISLTDVDNILLEIPGIREAAATAMPHGELGECIGAGISCQPDAVVGIGDVRKFYTDNEISLSKLPDVLHTVEEIPLTGMGKVDRTRLRERLIAIERES
ncbi:AMP-binding protein [Nocardia gipuzkoensis]